MRKIKGVSFTLARIFTEKNQEVDLSQLYNNDSNFSLQMRMIASLAFYPPEKVNEAFDVLAEILPGEANDVTNYFEDTYIDRPTRRYRRPPRFDTSVWNMYSRVQDDLPKTNNAVEGWHRRISWLFPPKNLDFHKMYSKRTGFT